MLNKQSVMRCISNHGPINRSATAKMVGLSIPTVMEITDKLLEHGMVVAEMKQGKGQGKRPELLRVCGEHFRFIGVDVGRTTIRIVLVGLDQQIIDMVKYATEDVHCARRFVERICAEIMGLTQRSGVDMDTIVGVCVAMPGLIERESGRVIFSPNFGWEDIPLQGWMNEILPFEVIVENANRVQASWEVFRNPENNRLTVLCVGLGYGIGGGLLQAGKLYYGASGTSGEVGHIPVCHDPYARCSCGNVGCLGNYLDFRRAAAEGTMDAQLEIVTTLFTTLVNLLNPQAIILGDDAHFISEENLARIERELNERFYLRRYRHVDVMHAQRREDLEVAASVIGVIAETFKGNLLFNYGVRNREK